MADDAVMSPGVPSDSELLAAIAAVVAADEQVPADAVEAAVAVFTWHSVDAELLELLYDSAIAATTRMRTEETIPRLMTFTLPQVIVEIELLIDQSWLVRGMITPPSSYVVELQQGSGRVATQSSDGGMFELTAIDLKPLRLIITTDPNGGRFVTPWIDLTPS